MPKLKQFKGLKRTVTGLTVALCFNPAFASEEVYSWVDENGITNYSERKPTGYQSTSLSELQQRERERAFGYLPREREQIAPEATPTQSADSDTPVESGGDVDPDALIAEEKAKYERELAEERRVNCALAKQNLARLETYARIRVKGDDGKMRYLTPDEMSEKKKDSRQSIRDHCRG